MVFSRRSWRILGKTLLIWVNCRWSSSFFNLAFQKSHPNAGVPIFVEHWGDNSQFYPNFALFLTLGGMNLDHDFVQVSKLSEDQKKSLHQKWNTFFPEFQWTPTLR